MSPPYGLARRDGKAVDWLFCAYTLLGDDADLVQTEEMMAWSEEERDAKSFAEVQEALAGKRFAFGAGSSKLMRFMLEGPEGCDATLSADRFEIRFGWNPFRHRYLLRTAPGIVSWLIELAKAPAGKRSWQALIGPAEVPAIEDPADGVDVFPGWSFGLRRIWIDASPTLLSLRARSPEPGDTGEQPPPAPFPELADLPRRTLEWPSPISCPHCSTPSNKFRELQGTYLVCAACGRSFAIAEVM